jgi:hypothetical protein
MTELLVALGAVVLAVVGSEIALGGRKVQTGLGRALAVFAAVGFGAGVFTGAGREGGMLVFLVFWAGVLASWFVVRSHLESSILLRMVHLLRRRAMSAEELLAAYEADYGPRQRVEELIRSGLAVETASGLQSTAKGRTILAAADWLRGSETPAPRATRPADHTPGGG